MTTPPEIEIQGGELPTQPGVYLFKDAAGKILYIGKATSLRTRVRSYFQRPADARIAVMIRRAAAVDLRPTPTAIEALLLESRLIKKHQPPFNVREKDDKSRVFLAFTREDYPQPVLVRGHELVRMPKKGFLKVFGPFLSAASVQAALDALRRPFPWTTCKPGRRRPCFYRHLGKCPGVCTGEITPRQYRKIIRSLMRYFDGRRSEVIREMEREMERAAWSERFEEAAALRDRIHALQHVKDMAVLKGEDISAGRQIDPFGRIEGYDISNTGGQEAVGSMVVFLDGEPAKKMYRKFLIRTVAGPDDTTMMAEVLRRRFGHSGTDGQDSWPAPDIILVDGGRGQLNAAKRVLEECGLDIPLVGLAKGPDRKKDELVYDKSDHELTRLVHAFRPLFVRVRDEAHRFALSYHRQRRGQAFIAAPRKSRSSVRTRPRS